MSEKYEQIGVAVTCRGFEEYVRMFGLKEADLADGETLDVAGGASSFTAEANRLGFRAVAADPRYAKATVELASEAREEIDTSMSKLLRLQHRYDFSYYGSLDNHYKMRIASHQRFAADYGQPYRVERYIAASLPELPFDDGRFTVVLCSHFLFLYGEQFGYEFHRQAVNELLRVCKPGGQVRIYPITTLAFETYPELGKLLAELDDTQIRFEFKDTQLPFIPNSRRVLTLLKT